MLVGGDLRPGAQSLPLSAAELWGRAFEALQPRLAETRPGTGSRPAEIGLDLFPGNVLAFFCHRGVEGGDVFRLLERFDQLFVLLHADQNSRGTTMALKHDGFGLGRIDYFGELLTGFANAKSGHVDYCTTGLATLYNSSLHFPA